MDNQIMRTEKEKNIIIDKEYENDKKFLENVFNEMSERINAQGFCKDKDNINHCNKCVIKDRCIIKD